MQQQKRNVTRMISLILAEKIFSLFLMMFMGYAVVHWGLLHVEDSKTLSLISLLEKSLGDRTAVLLGERAAADTLILTPRTVSGREMLDAVCMPVGIDPEDVLVLAGGLPMLDMVRASSQSTAAADAPAELRLAAQKVTLTDAAAGSAVEVLYRMVRDAENLA